MLSFVSGARFLDLEVRLRKKQRMQVLRIPKGAHTKAPPRYHVSSSRQLMTAKATQLEFMTWGRARLGYTIESKYLSGCVEWGAFNVCGCMCVLGGIEHIAGGS